MTENPTSDKAHPQVRKFFKAIKSQKNRDRAYRYAKTAQRLLDHLELEPEEIDPVDVEGFLGHCREEGYSDSSISWYASCLKVFFRKIGQYDLSKSIEIPDYQQEEPDWIEDHDRIRELIHSTQYPRGEAILAVGYELALRAGEVPKLRVEEFEPEKNRINVRRLKHRGNPNQYLLPIRDRYANILNQWLQERKRNSEQIFPYTSQTVSNTFRRTAKRIDMPEEYSFHTLRHSRITHAAIDMLENEGTTDLMRLAKFAGHVEPKTTMQYVHLAEEYLQISTEKRVEVSIPGQEEI